MNTFVWGEFSTNGPRFMSDFVAGNRFETSINLLPLAYPLLGRFAAARLLCLIDK